MPRLAVLARSVVVAGGVGLAAACTSPIDNEICPALAAGDLVVTEIRANQPDTFGQYIEIYNASGSTRDLRGLTVTLRSAETLVGRILVRRALSVAAGEAIVLGGFPDQPRPAHVDYGWNPDFLNDDDNPRPIPPSGDLELSACGAVIDLVEWTALPADGTYSLGLSPPDATGNDNAAAWCPNITNDTDPDTIGLPGTPGESNPPCP